MLRHELLLFFGGEVVLDVEELADLGGALVLDQRGDLGVGEFEQRLDVQELGGLDEFEELLLLHVDVVGVPGANQRGHVIALERLLDLGRRVVLEVGAELDHLFHDGLPHVGEGDLLLQAPVVDRPDQRRDFQLYLHLLVVAAQKLDFI